MFQSLLTHKKRAAAALILGLAVTVILQATLLAQQCYGIRENVLRLHILAHSDSQTDQQLKLQVRDALLTQGAQLLNGAQTKQEAITLAKRQLSHLQQIAQDIVQKSGSNQQVTVTIADVYFNTRYYETVTLPAGTYTALQVVLGDGKGQNWWCVMFPNLCLPAAADDRGLNQVLTEGQADFVEGKDAYKIKFKTVEWVQSALHKCKEWW